MSEKKEAKNKSTNGSKNKPASDAADYCPIKADLFNRLLAKFIDVLIASTLWLILPDFAGFLAAVTYMLIADGMPPSGQSLGKRFIGLRVIRKPMTEKHETCSWKHSAIRNIPFALAAPALSFGFIGVLLALVGIVILVFEVYFVVADDQGIRLGDIFANTKVLNN